MSRQPASISHFRRTLLPWTFSCMLLNKLSNLQISNLELLGQENLHVQVPGRQGLNLKNRFLPLYPKSDLSLLNMTKPKSTIFRMRRSSKILTFLLRFLKRFKPSSIHTCRDAHCSLLSLTSGSLITGLFVYLRNLDF